MDSNLAAGLIGAAATLIAAAIPAGIAFAATRRRRGKGLEHGTIEDLLVTLDRFHPLQGLGEKLAKAKKVKMCGWSLCHVVDSHRYSLRDLPPGCELQILLLDPSSTTVENLNNIITHSDSIAYKRQGGWPKVTNTEVCSSDIRATIAILRENGLLAKGQTVRFCNSLLPFGLILVECADGEAWLTVQIYTLHPNLRFDRRLAFSLRNKGSRLWALLEEQFDLAWEDPNFSRGIETESLGGEQPTSASTGRPASPFAR